MMMRSAITTQQDPWQLELPPALEQSRLFRSGGYVVTDGLTSQRTLAGLLTEAQTARPQSTRSSVSASDGAEGRGGCPARAFRSAPGGRLHWEIYGSDAIAEWLSGLSGVGMKPLGAGTYTYYEEPGDFLAVHRDVVACDLAVITCLTDAVADLSAGCLLVYPALIPAPLSAVRAAGSSAATAVPLRQGQTAVLLGGVVPHEVTPMAAAQERIVAVMCYRMQEGRTTPEFPSLGSRTRGRL